MWFAGVCQPVGSAFRSRGIRSARKDLERSWVYSLASPRAKDGIPTEPSFRLQAIEGRLLQSLPQVLARVPGVPPVPCQRRQQRADIFSVLPTTFGLLANQMKTGNRDRVAFE
jgi:hypothetical protein